MPYNTQSEQIAFFNGSMPIPRYLPIDSHPRREMLGNTSEIYEKKQVERENLIRVRADWVEKLSKQPMCVWESDKKHETLKELKRFRRNPEVAVPELKKSYYGCVHLIEQWKYLEQIVDKDCFAGDFKTSDETLLLGLCEIPFWNRDQNFDFMPVAEMTPEEAHAHMSPFIRKKIDSLTELSLAQRAEEERERELAVASPEFFPDKTLRRLARELHTLERELIAIFTYVQSLLKPEATPVELTSVEIVQTAQLSPKSIEHTVVAIELKTLEKTPEPTPASPAPAPSIQPSISKPVLLARPTPPAPAKPTGGLSRKQARKLRMRKAERHKSERELSFLIERRFVQTNILPITVGKSWF